MARAVQHESFLAPEVGDRLQMAALWALDVATVDTHKRTAAGATVRGTHFSP